MKRAYDDIRRMQETVEGLQDEVGKIQQKMVTNSVMAREVQNQVAAALKAQAHGGGGTQAQNNSGKFSVKISGKIYSYSLQDKMGEGGQGSVYRGKCSSDGSMAALKIMEKGSTTQQREFENLAKLSKVKNKNIVQVLGTGELSDGKHIVLGMELIDGISYDKYLEEQGGKISWQKAKQDFVQILKGMKAVHGVGIVHRDLKPANIVRKRKNGQCIIVDFGLSKDQNVNMGTMTNAGQFKGTRVYAAPELTFGPPGGGGEVVTPALDVFSMGVILYESITGSLPWSSDGTDSTNSSDRASIQSISSGFEGRLIAYTMNSQKTPIPLSPDEAPASINGFATKCLARDPKARFPTAAEMLPDWESAVEKAMDEMSFWKRNFGDKDSLPAGEIASRFQAKFSVASVVVQRLLEDMDKNSDGGISKEEFEEFFSGQSIEDKINEYKDKIATEKENVYDDRKLEISPVYFQSKGTMLGGTKDRTGCLVMQHGEVVAYRYTDNSGGKSAVYWFSVTDSQLGGMSVSGKASLQLNPDKRGKPRNFEFDSQDNMQRFIKAFNSTKAALLEDK
jgi:serine/threonine protein kinase